MTYQDRLEGRIIVCPDFFSAWAKLDENKLVKFIRRKSNRLKPAAFLLGRDDHILSTLDFEQRKHKIKILRDYFSNEQIPFIVNVTASTLKESYALSYWLHNRSDCKGISYTPSPGNWKDDLAIIINNLSMFQDFRLILRIEADTTGSYPSLQNLSTIYQYHPNIIAIKIRPDLEEGNLVTSKRLLPVRIFFNGEEKGIWENERTYKKTQLVS